MEVTATSYMKRPVFLILYALALILAALLAVKAQPAATAPTQPPAGYTEVTPARKLPGIFGYGGCYMREGGGVFDEARLKPLLERKECAEELKALNVDFAKHTLVGWSAHSDCHMSAHTKVFRSETEKKYLVIVNNIYGGCRASGSRSGWIVLNKIPADYTLDMKEVRVDRIHGINAGGADFYFPKPKSNIKPVLIESREVEVLGCLPLERQSQWILIKEEFLQTALDGKNPECRQLFKNLAIDFDKYTLAGYNVNTGDCQRPPGLGHQVFNDAGEKRYVMEISYIRNHGSCHVPRWHAVWVLVPKLPGDYGFEFKLNPKERPDETKPQARSY
jgi:hypothetical protein